VPFPSKPNGPGSVREKLLEKGDPILAKGPGRGDLEGRIDGKNETTTFPNFTILLTDSR